MISKLKSKLLVLREHRHVKTLSRLSKWSKPHKLWGVPVRIHSSAALLVALVLLSRGPWSIVALAVGLVLHEYAHIWTARALDVKTERVEITGVGAAAIQGDGAFEKFFNNGDVEMKIAAAGPLMSAVLASAGYIAATVALVVGLPYAAVVFAEFGFINTVLGCFNMFPILPLDGGRVLRGFLHQHYFHHLKDKKRLNEIFYRIPNGLKHCLPGAAVGGIFLPGVPGAALVLWYVISTSLVHETKEVRRYIKHLQRQHNYVPDRVTPQIRKWWLDLGLTEKPRTFRLAQRAYWKKVCAVHPDKGGSDRDMKITIRAYKMAKRSFGVA